MAPKHTITPIALIKVTPFIAMKMMQYLFQDNQGDGQMMRKLLFMANCGNSDFPFSFLEKKKKNGHDIIFYDHAIISRGWNFASEKKNS